jgi:hypothetical protein
LKFLNSEIERLEPEILIISNMSDRYVSYGTQRGVVIRDKEGNQPWNYKDALKVWEGNLRDVLTALPVEQKTLVLSQPPFSKFLNPSLINPNAPHSNFGRKLEFVALMTRIDSAKRAICCVDDADRQREAFYLLR